MHLLMFMTCTLHLQDMLISLKMLVIQRAKVLGYEDLAMKFDLKVLRTLGMFSFLGLMYSYAQNWVNLFFFFFNKWFIDLFYICLKFDKVAR